MHLSLEFRWVYFEGNDLTNLEAEIASPFLKKYLQSGFSQNLIGRQKEVDNRLNKYIEKEKEKEKSNIMRKIKGWLILSKVRKLFAFDDSDLLLFSEILGKAKAEVESWGGEFYFVYLPDYQRYSRTVNSHDDFLRKSEVIELVRTLNIPVVDIHEKVFSDAYIEPLDMYPFGLPGHFNAAGYAEVAKEIVESVGGAGNYSQ